MDDPADWLPMMERNTVEGERSILKDYVRDPRKKLFVDGLPVAQVYFFSHALQGQRRPVDPGEHLRYLRAVGGAGDAEWYQTKAEAEAGPSPRQVDPEWDIEANLERIAAGDLGAWEENFRGWLEIRWRQFCEWMFAGEPEGRRDPESCRASLEKRTSSEIARRMPLDIALFAHWMLDSGSGKKFTAAFGRLAERKLRPWTASYRRWIAVKMRNPRPP